MEDTRAEAEIASTLKAEVASLRTQLSQQREQPQGDAASDSSAAGKTEAVDEHEGAAAASVSRLEQALEAARAGAADATQRAEAAEAALDSLRMHSSLEADAPAAHIVAAVLRKADARQSNSSDSAAATEPPAEHAAALKRADELAAQLAEAEKLRTDAEEHAAQLAQQLEAAEEDARAAAATAAAQTDAARATDAAVHAELEDAQQQVRTPDPVLGPDAAVTLHR